MTESTGLGKRAAAEDAEEGDKLYRFAMDWPRKANFPSLSFTVSAEQLKQRDPEGLSVLSGKIGMLGSSGSISGKQIALSPLGPKHHEMMSPALMRFVFGYITEGKLKCPPEVSPVDAWLALDYFGFPAQDLDITLADDDPSKMHKAMKFAAFKRTKSAVPKLIDFVKETIQKDCCSSNVSGKGKDRDQYKGHLGFHFLVAPERAGGWLSRDILMSKYNVDQRPAGVLCRRFMDSDLAYDILSSDTSDAQEARDALLTGVLSLGGLTGKWVTRYLVVDGPEEDRGFNHDDIVHKCCYVLEIEVSKEAPDDTYCDGILELVSCPSEEEDDAEEDGDEAQKPAKKTDKKAPKKKK